MQTDRNTVRVDAAAPFLRWAGGKSWLAKNIPAFVENFEFNCYHEPFVGGGSMYFILGNSKKQAFLSDLNHELIETYKAVRDDCEKIIEVLRTFRNESYFYYFIRENEFSNRFERAAKFIFLNQTSYNGIYRVNLKGKYNVPYGGEGKTFLDEKGLKTASARLKNTKIFASDFYKTIKNVRKNDLVFIDPPYTVSHNRNGFIKYNEKLFSIEDQYRLSKYMKKIDEIGAFYVMTNANHEKVRDIFSQAKNQIVLSRSNLIGGKQAQRGSVTELMLTNLEVQ